MPVRRGQIFCQRCLAANPVERDLCERCGTRLMLVVEPAAHRFEDDSGACDYEEHLLERVTVLEHHLTRFAEKLEKTLDLLLRQARSSYMDHALVESLIALLAEAGTINRQTLITGWREMCERENMPALAAGRADAARDRVLAHGAGGEGMPERFERLVREGFRRVGEGDRAGGVRELEKAAAMVPTNTPLHAFIGEYFFGEGKTALARDYLSRALAEPEAGDWRVRLLLGLACGDEGDARRAKELLNEAIEGGGPSFAAHYALGRLLAAESDWKSALAEFKRALGARECPEAHYVLGLVYYELERYPTALRHLTKAVKTSPDYGEAFYLLGLVRLRLGQKEQACEAFDAAQALDREEPRYRAARRAAGRRGAIPPPAPALVSTKGRARRGLVTGGDLRLAAALRADALGGSPSR